MTPRQLRRIVALHGGTRAFAARLKVSQRIVQMWLKGERRIRPMAEDRIRQLNADHPTLSRVKQGLPPKG